MFCLISVNHISRNRLLTFSGRGCSFFFVCLFCFCWIFFSIDVSNNLSISTSLHFLLSSTFSAHLTISHYVQNSTVKLFNRNSAFDVLFSLLFLNVCNNLSKSTSSHFYFRPPFCVFFFFLFCCIYLSFSDYVKSQLQNHLNFFF